MGAFGRACFARSPDNKIRDPRGLRRRPGRRRCSCTLELDRPGRCPSWSSALGVIVLPQKTLPRFSIYLSWFVLAIKIVFPWCLASRGGTASATAHRQCAASGVLLCSSLVPSAACPSLALPCSSSLAFLLRRLRIRNSDRVEALRH